MIIIQKVYLIEDKIDFLDGAYSYSMKMLHLCITQIHLTEF